MDHWTIVRPEEQNGYVYVYLRVNKNVDDVVLTVGDSADSAEHRCFLDGLDTFVPGECVVSRSGVNLHVIAAEVPRVDAKYLSAWTSPCEGDHCLTLRHFRSRSDSLDWHMKNLAGGFNTIPRLVGRKNYA